MYYTGIDPLSMKKVYVVTDYHEKQLQRALLQYNRPQNADMVREALTKAGRTDLIGFGEKCLIPPRRMKADNSGEKKLGKNRPARAKLQGTGGTKGNFKAGRGKPASGKGKTARRRRGG
jgi:predicted NBD/HSP70 family sugar kinase